MECNERTIPPRKVLFNGDEWQVPDFRDRSDLFPLAIAPNPTYWGLVEDDFAADDLEAVVLVGGALGPASFVTLSINW